jgi:hypothetical protein
MPYPLVFAEQKIKDEYNKLKNGTFEEKKLYDNIKKHFDLLENNLKLCTYVDRPMVDKPRPKQIKKRYGLNNLWKCNLNDGWRLIYSVSSNDTQQIGIIVCWMTHVEYNKTFGYK